MASAQESFSIEESVAALGSFLSVQSVTPERSVIIQEVYRDFCNFIAKDPATATSLDFSIYSELHAQSGDRDAFTANLNLIEAFCKSLDKPKASGNNARAPIKRTSTKTCRFETSPDLLEVLFSPELSEKAPAPRQTIPADDTTKQPGNEATRQPKAAQNDVVTANPVLDVLEASDIQHASKKRRNIISQTFDKFDFSMDDSLAGKLSPEQSGSSLFNEYSPDLDSGLSLLREHRSANAMRAIKSSPGFGSVSGNYRSISANMSSAVFSPVPGNMSSGNYTPLPGNMSSGNYNPISRNMPSGGYNPVFGHISSGSYRPVSDMKSSGSYHSVQQQRSAAHRAVPTIVRSDSIAEEILADSQLRRDEIPQNNELLPGVDNIDYDFSKQNIRNIRESKKAVPSETKNSAISSSSDSSHWVFEGKYQIDVPLPVPSQMQPCAVSPVQRFLIPLTPTIVVVALALAIGSIIAMVGVGLLLIAAICLIIALPAMRSASQQTPQGALTTSLNAKAGACVALGTAVIARPTSDEEDPSISDIWQDDAPNPMMAFLNRFRTIETPHTRIVSGSESQNTLIMLYTSETKYYIVPMVRLNGKWYLAVPEPVAHDI